MWSSTWHVAFIQGGGLLREGLGLSQSPSRAAMSNLARPSLILLRITTSWVLKSEELL
jgi:hypothetical protein